MDSQESNQGKFANPDIPQTNQKRIILMTTPPPETRKSSFSEADEMFWLLDELVQNKINWEHEQILFTCEHENQSGQGKGHKIGGVTAIKSDMMIEFGFEEDLQIDQGIKTDIKTPQTFGVQDNFSALHLPLQLEGQPQKKEHVRCNCKKSKCLKMYCECFRGGRECKNCGCSCCMNNSDGRHERKIAIKKAKQKNPSLFIQSSYKGCYCSKSKCLKGYCECFLNGLLCGKYCKCTGCENCSQLAERKGQLNKSFQK